MTVTTPRVAFRLLGQLAGCRGHLGLVLGACEVLEALRLAVWRALSRKLDGAATVRRTLNRPPGCLR